jgi:hypothetical protein
MSSQLKACRSISRRKLISGMVLGPIAGSLNRALASGQPQEPNKSHDWLLNRDKRPATPLVPWIFVHSPLEQWMSNYKQTFDAWEKGGVRGIVVGRLYFFEKTPHFEPSYLYQYEGKTYPAFLPDPEVYKSFGVAPPSVPSRDRKKEIQFRAMIDDAASRGWEILFFGTGQAGGSLPPSKDPFNVVGFAAAFEDTMRAFPQAHGVVIDGAGEQPYELAFHHGGEVLEIPRYKRAQFQELGYDTARMDRGVARLRDRLHQLTPPMVRYYSSGGTLGGLALLDINEDTLYWLRARQEATMRYMAALRSEINKLPHKAKLGTIPRSAAFSILTTEDFVKTHQFFDYIFPKHYFWNRGFDGMYGVVARWVRRLSNWNPSLTEPDCFAVVKSVLGLELPGIHSIADMEQGFPDEFYSQVVAPETRRALDAVGDDNKVIAWVSSGRHPHAGDPMPSGDLYRILVASHRAGLKRFVYHPDPNLGAAEWEVISELCGQRWKEDPSGYWPSDTPKPDSWNGGRKPGDNR